jgi:hypothetical protein
MYVQEFRVGCGIGIEWAGPDADGSSDSSLGALRRASLLCSSKFAKGFPTHLVSMDRLLDVELSLLVLGDLASVELVLGKSGILQVVRRR